MLSDGERPVRLESHRHVVINCIVGLIRPDTLGDVTIRALRKADQTPARYTRRMESYATQSIPFDRLKYQFRGGGKPHQPLAAGIL